MSSKIDDLIDALEAVPKEGLDKKFVDLALTFTSPVFPPTAILKTLRNQFAFSKGFERIEHVCRVLESEVKRMEVHLSTEQDKMERLQTRLESPQFGEAIGLACEEALRTTNLKRVECLARVLAGSLTPTRWSSKDEDVATLIRDLAQLSDRDLDVLGKLSLAFGAVMVRHPELSSNTFTGNNAALDRIVQEAGDSEEFYSACGRLIGFGLAVEVEWPMNHTAPHGRCIRPTRRGLALLAYLGKFAKQ
jgi:hypothetical protein